MTGQEIGFLQGGLWLGAFLLLYVMGREKHEPTPDFVRAALLMGSGLISVLLLAMWLL